MIALNGATRKCGSLVKGACYGGGLPIEKGSLRAWTWFLGKPWEDELARYTPEKDERMIYCSGAIPPRTQIEIVPRETIAQHQVWLAEWGLTDDSAERFGHIAEWGLADHVGSQYYTAWNFAHETIVRGPNRRLTRQNAKRWALSIPIPIFFSHSKIPVFRDEEHANAFVDHHYVNDPDETLPPYDSSWAPTWTGDSFGMSAAFDHYDGSEHPMCIVLEIIDMIDSGTSPEPPEAIAPLRYEEAIFGASWLTYVCYTLGEGKIPADLANAGVDTALIT